MKIFCTLVYLASYLTSPVMAQSKSVSCPDCNVIMISLTSLRKENMGIYGYHRNTTPNIGQFFSDAYRFTNAFAPASLTYTDAISVFYSLSPQIHKNFERFQKHKLKAVLEKYPSLPETLAQNGYSTAAFVSDEDYSYDRGVGRTFHYYFDRSLYPDHDILFKPFTYSIGTKQLVPEVNKWLTKNHKKKFMLFLQAFDMHCPYSTEGEFASLYPMPHSENIPFTSECFMTQKDVVRTKDGKISLKSFFAYLEKQEREFHLNKRDQDYLVSRYDAELNQTDARLLPLFKKIKELNLDKNTIIILTSDHGDNLGENGFFMKMSPLAQGNLLRNNLGFPLLVKLPLQKGIKQEQIMQSIDLAPSILEMLNLKVPSSMQGKSFVKILNSDEEINDYAYAYSVRYDQVKLGEVVKKAFRLESIIGKEWKLDYSFQTEFSTGKFVDENYYLYHLKSDPLEKTNLIKKSSAKFAELKKVLQDKREAYSKTK